MKTFIAIPCMDKTDTLFDNCLDNLKPVGQISKNRLPGSLVYIARNELTKAAIEQKADYILWIDSDMVFTSDMLECLMVDIMENDCDIVSSICFWRKAPFNPVIYKKLRKGLTPDENEVEIYKDYPKDSLFEIEGCGFGCVLMKAEVAETMLGACQIPFSPIPGFGEDLAFCLRARQLGYHIYCDSRVKVGHIAQTIVTEETYDAYNRGKE